MHINLSGSWCCSLRFNFSHPELGDAESKQFDSKCSHFFFSRGKIKPCRKNPLIFNTLFFPLLPTWVCNFLAIMLWGRGAAVVFKNKPSSCMLPLGVVHSNRSFCASCHLADSSAAVWTPPAAACISEDRRAEGGFALLRRYLSTILLFNTSSHFRWIPDQRN